MCGNGLKYIFNCSRYFVCNMLNSSVLSDAYAVKRICTGLIKSNAFIKINDKFI